MKFRLTRPEPDEAQVSRELVTVMRIHPKIARFVRYNSGNPNGRGSAYRCLTIDGDPDIDGHPDFGGYLYNGRAFYVEVKRRSGKESPAQEAFITHALKQGCLAIFARCAEDLLIALRDA
jgi:hypothetical protein